MSRALKSSAAVGAAVLLFFTMGAAPVQAEPPPNDDIATATVMSVLPARVTVDTTDATTAPGDGRCVGDHSVWFRFRAPRSGRIPMTTAGSLFNTRLAVFSGSRHDRTIERCDTNDGPARSSALVLTADAGQRYWVAVSSAGGGAAGPAVLTVGRVDEPDLTLTIESATSGSASGRMRLQGTVSCVTPSSLRIGGTVSQRVSATDGADAIARGWGGGDVRRCWTEPVAWQVSFDSETGYAFQPGPAAVELRVRGWDGILRYSRGLSEIVVAEDDPLGRPVE